MGTPLRVLLVEDSDNDAVLVERELRSAWFEPVIQRVETGDTMTAALHEQQWDVVLADYILPQFSAPAAFSLLKVNGLDIPFIIISGSIGEERAIEIMRAGAHDYVLKGVHTNRAKL